MNRIIPESLPPALELFDALLAADLADDRPLAALTLLSVVPVLSQSAGRTKSDQNHRRHCRVVTHARKDEPPFVHAPAAPPVSQSPSSVSATRISVSIHRFLKRQIRTSLPENFTSNRKFANEGQNKHQHHHHHQHQNIIIKRSSWKGVTALDIATLPWRLLRRHRSHRLWRVQALQNVARTLCLPKSVGLERTCPRFHLDPPPRSTSTLCHAVI